ncbi:DUF4280 domain-containing protein [Pelosinus fermentans]|uniref:DUF4280 domain-containing protein n=1 Tax=Pelosinus fermentans JBW45 TaxID=1192197 RepID=I9NM12_9FIRM|nr:DUF4280 domain-containing protein [Pelosinus fermentans]AJQ28473.1 Protein of unknown function DUF4280 [Pelosinus fermentans JBW45]
MSTTASGPAYIPRGTKSKCSKGSSENILNLPVDHGVAYTPGLEPLLNANDHKPGEHILKYGFCAATKLPCSPVTPLAWINVNKKHILEGAPALIEQSKLTCVKGGVISIVINAGSAQNDDHNEAAADKVEAVTAATEAENPYGFKQAVKDAIDNGILPNPATMQSDYEFIEGGLSTPIFKIASLAGGFILDKKGNVYAMVDASVGYGLGLPYPVTGSVGQGYFGNADKSSEEKYRDALAGGSIGTTTGAGIQGNASIGVPSGVISGEVSFNPSIGKSFGGRYAWYLFNVNE